MDWFLYDRNLCHERVKGYRNGLKSIDISYELTNGLCKGLSLVKKLNEILSYHSQKKSMTVLKLIWEKKKYFKYQGRRQSEFVIRYDFGRDNLCSNVFFLVIL